MVKRLLGQLPSSLLGEVLANLRAGVVLQDEHGAMVACNPSAPALLRLTADELLGRTSLDPSWHVVDEQGAPLPGERHPAMRCLRSRTVVEGVVMGVRLGDGDTVWLQVDSYPTEWGDGPGALTIFHDVTASRVREIELRSTVETLQRALLPETFPDLGWLHVEGHYRPPSATTTAGGDFYDLFEIADGRCGFFIGDVCGHGVTATSTMALARYTLRGLGHSVERPSEVLARLHETLTAGGVSEYCTAVYGVATRASDGSGAVDVELAVGGHPLPVLLPRDAPPCEVGVHGTLLGFPRLAPRLTDVSVRLGAGDQLLLYTDGLLECPEPRVTERVLLDRLRPGATPADTIGGALSLFPVHGRDRDDDTALLSLGVPAPGAAAAPV